GYAGHFPNPPYDKIAIRINELGYRDRPFPPRSGQSRIVVLGDSITFGAGIAAEERYTDAAERLCTGRCEVLNLGVNNYQTENYRAQLERHVDALDPDIVVVGFCMNDIRPMARIDDLDKVRRSGAINRLRGVLKSSQLLRVGSAIWRATTLDAKAYDERWIRLAIEAWQDEAGRERLSNTLEQIRDFTESRGIRLVVVLFPEKHQLEDFEAYGLPYSMAEKAMAELGIPTISLLPRMKSAIERGELAPTEIFLPKDNIHFTPRVHEWIAKILIDHLPLEIPRDTEQS
ncbi:MAG: SGNH/GDSL hydrolase family protein, partial [Planctomycetes bacterium]|nr:SGNH/GDSL hydrolase family protein [Planctomycetota bacterium]